LSHPLLSKLSSQFLPVIRDRGREYFDRGAVRVAEAEPERVLAVVQGTRRYTVDIRFRDAEVELSCSCPFFADQGQACKHLWAVLLKLDTGGYLDKRKRALRQRAAGTSAKTAASGAKPRPGGHRPAGAAPAAPPAPPPLPEWALALREIRSGLHSRGSESAGAWPVDRRIFYVLDVPRTVFGDQAVVRLYIQDRNRRGDWEHRRSMDVALKDLRAVPERRDRGILAVLRGTSYGQDYNQSIYSYQRTGLPSGTLFSTYRLGTDLARLLLPRMCATGRFYLDTGTGNPFEGPPLSLDREEPWELKLRLERGEHGGGYRLEGWLSRDAEGGQRMSLSEPTLLTTSGLLFAGGALSRYRDPDSFPWITALRKRRVLRTRDEELSPLVTRLLGLPHLPALELDESLGIRVQELPGKPRLRIAKAVSLGYSNAGGTLAAELSFDYGGQVVDSEAKGRGQFAEEEGLIVLRLPTEERKARERLQELGIRRMRDSRSGKHVFKLAARRLAEAVQLLLSEGWYVEAEGRIFRPAQGFSMWVSSGIDWLEVRGGMQFGDLEAPLPALLKAIKRGENTVRLGDGSYGILPEDWLHSQGLALRLGQAEADHLRFAGSQALVVDQLLRAQPEARSDEGFRELRRKIERFRELQALEPPPGFVGELRGYQKRGLGWFAFLDELGFGGCLADDMGLGKTVQVLALLEGRQRAGRTGGRSRRSGSKRGGGIDRGGPAPSLVVVPRSLLFNWKEEARRFAPNLRVLEHAGPARARDATGLAGWDVVLTTYGTLRNDITWLRELPFDYLILDEAQLIKNSVGVTARAARLLQGRRRLALSGTPIENHLGELWSLFEFLNPGLLGGVSLFRRTFKGSAGLDEQTRAVLARFLGPFILRRTKEQVAPELPDRVEQTLICELLPAERRHYRELQDYYRRKLRKQLRAGSPGKDKMQILEALLRLRQAACHPGLLDPGAASRPGAKIDLLIEQLQDVVAEERKALVFSQFTSLLAIVRRRLEERGIAYEYLDGRTRDRQQRVERFQTDPAIRLFLISLKAGGLGLNLTAAEYVFLLDPWWNPAVEMQAIDRTHRIGQDKKVFAYRLIARDTVEEKVVELQKSKRDLADSIIAADGRLIGTLSPEDLDFLLS